MATTQIFINVPYEMLLDRLDFAIQERLFPEIYFDGNALDNARQADINHLATALSENNIDCTLHGPYMDLSPGGVDAKVRDITLERLGKTMDLAALFKAKTVVFHPGFDPWRFEEYQEVWLEQSIDAWKPIARKAEEIFTTVAIENVFEEEPRTLISLIEEVNSPNFRFCFDRGHYFVFSKASLDRWLDPLGQYLVEVHLRDNHGTRDDHLPLGDGKMDFGQFFDLIGRATPRPIFPVKPHQEAHLWSSLKALEKYVS